MESASLASVVAQPPQLAITLRGYIGRGRFSTGIEHQPRTEATLRVGRFSDGIEEYPDTPGKLRVGRFSTGIEHMPDARNMLRVGSFADGYDRVI